MKTPTAVLVRAYAEEIDHTFDDQLVIRCFDCGARNGNIQLAISNGEVIGDTVLLDDRLVRPR